MDALPPDPYLALGVAKDATAAAIKTQYRKLVLKCHPDKVDDSQKVEAADKFHKIQTAWEIIGNEVRRKRYDTQCQLEQLRKETMTAREGAGRGGADIRTASYRMPTESARGDFFARGPERYAPRASPPYEPYFEPQYEERRPNYAQAQEDYFDQQPRPTSRKHDEYERSTKRSSPKEDRPKTKTSTRDAKENERSSRKDKSRRTEKDVRRDRDRKAAYVSVEDADSDSELDAYERRARKLRDDEAQKLARARFEDQMQREKEAADNGAYTDQRASKTLRDTNMAYNYIQRSSHNAPRTRPETVERRPSPVRMASSKDKVEALKREDARPGYPVRRGSGRIKTTRHDSKSGSDREREEYAEEQAERSRRSGARHPHRTPVQKTTSAPPAETQPGFERQRSYSVQEDSYDQPAPPQMKRSETMPTASAAAPSREARGRKEGSKLRSQETYPLTPEPTPPTEARSPKRYPYHAYADDGEYATPDGYRTEYREPSDRRIHHSPEPMQDRSRERQRSASSKKTAAPQPPPLSRTTSTQYRYGLGSRENSYSSRPAVSREDSGRLYGEVRPSASPRNSAHAGMYTPPPEKVTTSRSFTPDDVKYQTGYSRKSSDRPSVNRTYSRQGQPVF